MRMRTGFVGLPVDVIVAQDVASIVGGYFFFDVVNKFFRDTDRDNNANDGDEKLSHRFHLLSASK